MNRALFYLLLVVSACLLVLRGHGAGRNMQPRVAFTNSIDYTLILQLLDSGASSYGSGNAVTTWMDASPYGNNATNIGLFRPRYAQNVNGTGKNGVFFDGATHYMKFAATANLDITGDLTMMCWVFHTNSSGVERPMILIGGYNATGAGEGYGLGIGILATTRPAAWTDTTGNWRMDGYPVTLDSWNHIAVSISGGNCRFYLNGALGNTDVATSPSSFLGQRFLGADTAATNNFAGFMGDVRIYRRALTTLEITNIYNLNIR